MGMGARFAIPKCQVKQAVKVAAVFKVVNRFLWKY
jgi:hypothetical protein